MFSQLVIIGQLAKRFGVSGETVMGWPAATVETLQIIEEEIAKHGDQGNS